MWFCLCCEMRGVWNGEWLYVLERDIEKNIIKLCLESVW